LRFVLGGIAYGAARLSQNAAGIADEETDEPGMERDDTPFRRQE
jgi:hypothetical protein